MWVEQTHHTPLKRKRENRGKEREKKLTILILLVQHKKQVYVPFVALFRFSRMVC
jgi:hypothetical protein